MSAQPTMGDATSWPAVLGCISKQAEQMMERKPVSSIPPRPCFVRFLPAGSYSAWVPALASLSDRLWWPGHKPLLCPAGSFLFIVFNTALGSKLGQAKHLDSVWVRLWSCCWRDRDKPVLGGGRRCHLLAGLFAGFRTMREPGFTLWGKKKKEKEGKERKLYDVCVCNNI